MIEGYRRRLGLMQQSDPYGRDYLSPVGQGDTPDIIATDPRLYPEPTPAADRNAGVLEQYMPQGLIDWGQSVKAAQGKPSLFGKALGAIGLDESGRRGQTSWGDAAKATMWLPGDMVQGLADSVGNIAGYGGGSYHTSPEASDRARAAQLTGDVFNVAGALPMASAGMSAAGAKMAPAERVAYSNSKEGALPGFLRSAQAGEPEHIRAFHWTDKNFDKLDNAYTAEAGFHFGGMRQAIDRSHDKLRSVFGWPLRGKMIPVEIEARNILDMKSDPGSFSGYSLAKNLHTEGILPKDVFDTITSQAAKDAYAKTSTASDTMRSWLVDQGYDVVRYPNSYETGNRPSYMTMGTGNVRHAVTGNVLYSNSKEGALPGLLSSARAGEQRQQPGITAYHGSPHDFDRFSMDKIGIGEGAQAYGHGLYFAENEGVAKSYRDTVRNQWSSLDPETKPGHMYEVRINADPEHFLDWDKPLSQQSEKVREAALNIRNAAARAEYEKRGFPEPLIQEYLGNASKADKTGGQLVQGMKGANQSADFSQQLRDAGIPGIRYLDQGSRTAGEGSRNFVVFDDKLVSIVKKYGWAGAAAMLGMSADDLMSQAQAQQPDKPDQYREALRMKARAKVLGLPN